MIYYVGTEPYSSSLYHHGIKGQKWGIRRYQNEDGTLTRAGIARYGNLTNFNNHQKLKAARKERNDALSRMATRTGLAFNITKGQREKTKQARESLKLASENVKKAKAAYEKSSSKPMSKKAYETRMSVSAHQAHVLKQGARLAKTAIHGAAFITTAKIASNPNTSLGMRTVSAFLAGGNAGYMMKNALEFDMNRGKKFN